MCFADLGSLERIKYNELKFKGLGGDQIFKPISPHSMTVQLLMRPRYQDHKHFQEKEATFETLLGLTCLENGEIQAFTVILTRTGLGQYDRDFGVGAYLQVRVDLREFDYDDTFHALGNWSIHDVLISNPKPNIRPESHLYWLGRSLSLKCDTGLVAGVEFGGVWGNAEEDIRVEDTSGAKIYTFLFKEFLHGEQCAALTIRNTNSGEMCGLILRFKWWDYFGVSIVYDLAEKDFKQRAFFDHFLDRREVQKPRNLLGNVLSYKLKDGSHLFLSCDIELKVGSNVEWQSSDQSQPVN